MNAGKVYNDVAREDDPENPKWAKDRWASSTFLLRKN